MKRWASFQDRSIRGKLMWIGILASGSALILAGGSFLANDLFTFRRILLRRLITHAQIIGFNGVSSLMFQDSQSAVETLSALKADPGIKRAAIFNPQGAAFAVWRLDKDDQRPLPILPAIETEYHRFSENSLVLFQPLIFDGARLGTVFIETDLTDMRARMRGYMTISVVVLAFCLLAAAVVSARLGHYISRPILTLANAAKNVSFGKDYSLRLPSGGRDEIGVLISTFNEMLAQIQQGGEALRKSHEQLEKRVKERTAELEAANKELEAFSYSVSHDLRAPLRSIDGFSQALLEDYEAKLDDEGKDSLHRVRNATHRMGELIDDMLALSRLTRHEMRRETVDLTALARGVVEELRRAHPDRQVEVVVADDVKAQGDRELLRAVMENLIGNAWKFTAKKPAPRIEFGVAAGEDGQRVIFVKDNGAGFPMEYAHKLFGVFQRLHAAAEFPGTGVGLATVQRVINRHGGRVWADAVPGQGATFYFTI